MSGVFTRGRMRIYLLKLLEERPRHGYEMLQLLEERLGGTYTPSPGSVYPRLRRLEADGLVNHDESGGRKVYRLTDRGHAEVDARRADIDALESDIRSMSELAESLGADVRTTVRDIGDDLKAAAKRLTESTQHSRRRPHDRHRQAWPEAVEFDQSAGMIDAQLHVLVSRVRELVARRPPTSEQIGACAMILHDSYLRVSEVFADDEE